MAHWPVHPQVRSPEPSAVRGSAGEKVWAAFQALGVLGSDAPGRAPCLAGVQLITRGRFWQLPEAQLGLVGREGLLTRFQGLQSWPGSWGHDAQGGSPWHGALLRV